MNLKLKTNHSVSKKISGFTLVELIVVIAIIGVLAVLLIPNMMGKVKDAKQKTANDAAAKISEQAAILVAEMEAKGTAMKFGGNSFGYSADITELTGSSNEDSQTDESVSQAYFKSQMEKALPDIKNALWAITFNDDGSVKVVLYKQNQSKYIGTWPVKNVTSSGINPNTCDLSQFDYIMSTLFR